MLRAIGAVIAGVVVGGIGVFIVESVTHTVFPPPVGVDPTTPEGLARVVAESPLAAKLAVIVGYVVGALAGGFTAARLAGLAQAVVVGVVLTLAGLSNLVAIPHPMWMAILTVVVSVPAAWLGGRLARR